MFSAAMNRSASCLCSARDTKRTQPRLACNASANNANGQIRDALLVVQRRYESIRQLTLFSARHETHPAAARLQRQRYVLAHGEIGDNCFDLAVLRTKAKTMRDRIAR